MLTFLKSALVKKQYKAIGICFQVETIGDVYVIAAGLPERIGDTHIAEVVNCALDLMSVTYNLTVSSTCGIQQFVVELRMGKHRHFELTVSTTPSAPSVLNRRNFLLGSDDDAVLISGIHTGPIVTGVIGIASPHYGLFGDTINTASRMSTTGERE